MNYIKQQSAFMDRVAEDDRILPTHISMYLALFNFWNLNWFSSPFSISRSEIMKVSKISSKGTYHKTLRQLEEFGYIVYMPSHNPLKGSLVHMLKLYEDDQKSDNSRTTAQTSTEPVREPGGIKKRTSDRPVEEPYINNTNPANRQREKTPAPAEEDDRLMNQTLEEKRGQEQAPEEKQQCEPAPEKNEGEGRPDSLEEVVNYFREEKSTALEAKKFLYHYKSNGWMVGAKPMKDWRAAATKWILRAPLFTSAPRKKPEANYLDTDNDKDYSAPL